MDKTHGTESIRERIEVCPDCEGDGFYAGHTDEHKKRPDLDCSQTGCPVPRQCERCEATGLVWKEDLEEEQEAEPLNDLPF